MRLRFICSICQREKIGHGNNAHPVNDGRCCDECNRTVVWPARANAAKRWEATVMEGGE